MQTTTDIALSRLVSQQRSMDVIANNVANADTPGYKAQRVLFSTWISRQPGTNVPGAERVLDYTQDRATYRDNSAGSMSQTGNPLDIAIAGEGFFQVQTPQGVRLTRAGRFGLLPDGTVADSNGNALLDTAGRPVQVAPGDSGISITGDGSISTRNGATGKIAVVVAKDVNSLRAQGGRLFDTGSGTSPAPAAKLVQGAVEGSNVQPVLEMTRMMNQLREFQYVSEFVQAENDRAQNAIDKITKRS